LFLFLMRKKRDEVYLNRSNYIYYHLCIITFDQPCSLSDVPCGRRVWEG
jgi:hypothetical protein